jgi:hypothetical protein
MMVHKQKIHNHVDLFSVWTKNISVSNTEIESFIILSEIQILSWTGHIALRVLVLTTHFLPPECSIFFQPWWPFIETMNS